MEHLIPPPIRRIVVDSKPTVVVPQPALSLDDLALLDFDHRFLQPMDGPDATANTQWAIAQCLRDPRWRLSVQTHKVIGIR